ncbi:MAG: hypothetical protein P8Y42_01630, partial [Exilibacterium sp.]
IESLLTLGNLCLNDLDPTAAQPYFDKVLARQPENGRAWLGIGLKALLQKNLTAATDSKRNATLYADWDWTGTPLRPTMPRV